QFAVAARPRRADHVAPVVDRGGKAFGAAERSDVGQHELRRAHDRSVDAYQRNETTDREQRKRDPPWHGTSERVKPPVAPGASAAPQVAALAQLICWSSAWRVR